MEWLQRMSDSIDYLEAHMDSNIDIEEVAKTVISSKFHFQRMFYMLTGVTVAEYVRKRRLTLAAQELATSDVKVIDVALKYGYQTPESFSKAFRKIHGRNPSEVRESGIQLKAFPRLSFTIQLKGVHEMDYKIIKKDAFGIIGAAKRVTTDNGENFKIIPKFWEEAWQNGVCKHLMDQSGELGVMGVCMEYDQEQEEFTYMIAIENLDQELAGDFVAKEIPASTWAIFECVGPMPNSMQSVWKRIFSEWFPATGYEHAGTPELEIYFPGDPSGEDYRSQIWVPILNSDSE